jgi:hypothetical protein
MEMKMAMAMANDEALVVRVPFWRPNLKYPKSDKSEKVV